MMRREADFVTFTGLDDATDMGRVLELSSRYPVEWAILFSPKEQGLHPRFPSLFTVGRLTHAASGRLRLAAHLCGGHARSVLAKARCGDLNSWIDGEFARFQVNTADPSADPAMVAEFAGMVGGERGILQCRGDHPDDPRVDWLFDASGGRGVTPAAWPVAPTHGGRVGYAGGIGPSTVGAALGAIDPGSAGGWWIDAESGVRDADDRLDLDKCEAVCRAVFGDGRK